MKITHLLCWFACLLIAAVELSGCADHLSPGSFPARLRVKSLTQVVSPNPFTGATTSTTTISGFNYDQQGRLAVINTYQTPDNTAGPIEISVYQYNAQNRVTQLRRDIVTGNPNNPLLYEIYQYNYNAANQVSGINYTNSNAGTSFGLSLSYNAVNQLTGSFKAFSFAPISYQRTQTYAYTGNNVTGVTTNLQTNFMGSGTGSATYTYDDKINPFYGTLIIPAPLPNSSFPNLLSGVGFTYYTYYGGLDNLLNLSKNNLLTIQPASQPTTYTYTYNSDNLPTSRITTATNTALNITAVTETLYYTYESY